VKAIKDKYPALNEFINGEGHLDIGSQEYGVSAIAYDEGGLIWEGKESYGTLEELLKDAEKGVKKWMKENW